MPESFVAVIVSVPEEYYSDDDELCHAAGNYVCEKLQSHLVDRRHSIPRWIEGGCEEDWGVYFESEFNQTRFQYYLCYFPGPVQQEDYGILVQYSINGPFLSRLFGKPPVITPSDPMQETMRLFGNLFHESRMLTQSQLDREY
ncbi:hypothetical protein GC197_12470 [bacterium]|nr:hypothetical protein [bacterium]